MRELYAFVVETFLLVHRKRVDGESFHADAVAWELAKERHRQLGEDVPKRDDEGEVGLLRCTLDKGDESKDRLPILRNARLGGLIVAPKGKDVEEDRLGLLSQSQRRLLDRLGLARRFIP